MAAHQPETPAGLALGLAGEFTLRAGDRPLPLADVGSRKARTLLKLLAVERGTRLRVDRIAEVLWPDDPPAQPGNNIATLVSRLRSVLGPAVIDGSREGYRLGGPPVVQVDLDLAKADLLEARRRSTAEEHALAAAAAARALQLLGDGEVLPEDADAEWAEPARVESAQLLRQGRHVQAYSALALNDPATANDLATAATTTDPYDEEALRLRMRAEAALGEPARALATYERFRQLLADEFGVDPAAETREIHVAILQERQPATGTPAERRRPLPARDSLVGRDDELHTLREAWIAAAGGAPSLLLITGEAGIGKTRLATEIADEAARSGGTVLSARCYEAERSLFLQPFVEAIGAHAVRASAGPLPVGEAWTDALAALVPKIAQLVGPSRERDRGEVARRRAYDAVARYIRRLTQAAPTLVLLDDLHNAGLATVELLHFLIRQAATEPLFVLATVRSEEGTAVRQTLDEVARSIELGPLSGIAVARLAGDAGHADFAEGIVARTHGHTLFVVETLRALTAQAGVGGVDITGTGIPESLQAAVLARVRRTGPGIEQLLRAAAVLGAAIEPDTLARMLDVSPALASDGCEQAMAARLLTVAGRAYEFANDLIREVLYETMPLPTRVSYHRRAADLLADHPEAVGTHAAAAADWSRAAKALLLAGEAASMGGAAADARALLTRALDAAEQTGELEVEARIRLARGRAHDALTAYPAALGDFQLAADLARKAGDQRLEMIALRELGGDVPVALGISVTECAASLQRSLTLAEALGDRATESDVLARLAVIACNGLNFVESLALGSRAVHAAKASNDERALAVALDGQKTGYAYLGEIASLMPIAGDLEPMLRRQGDLWRLPWTIQETAFVDIAAGAWERALSRISEAREINLQSGYLAYDAWFVGQLAWVHRLSGDTEQALACARAADLQTRDSIHAWWRTAACEQLGKALLASGDQEGAIELLSEGRERANRSNAEAFQLRCLAPLAEITRDLDLLDDADALVRSIVAPAGCAWLLGAEAYLSVARSWVHHGEPERARATVAPLLEPARRNGWHWVHRAASEI